MTSIQPDFDKTPSLREDVVAFCGTRGIPANYGGFETVVEEISKRFSERKIDTEVFCRRSSFDTYPESDNGRRLTWVAGSKSTKLDTFLSSIQTGWHLWRHRREYAYVLWYNNANLPGILMTLLARLPMAINTNGLEWRRAKWSPPFRAYYYIATWLISKLCRTIVSDSIGIKDFYKENFGATSHYIPYGVAKAPAVGETRALAILDDLGLEDDRFFIQITRFEPDNLPLEVVRAFQETRLAEQGYKMVVIGFSSQHDYAMQIKEQDGRNGVVIMKATYDQEILAVLRGYASGYVHGNSVGGTNPALLEAMLTCRKVMAIDIRFSQEVLGETGLFFKPHDLVTVFRDLLDLPDRSEQMRNRLKRLYCWDEVSDSYLRLTRGHPADYRPERIDESHSEFIES